MGKYLLHIDAWIAQPVEHQTFNLRVQGSSPCSGGISNVNDSMLLLFQQKSMITGILCGNFDSLQRFTKFKRANSTFNKLFVFVAINLSKLSKGQNDASFCSTSQLRRLGQRTVCSPKNSTSILIKRHRNRNSLKIARYWRMQASILLPLTC